MQPAQREAGHHHVGGLADGHGQVQAVERERAAVAGHQGQCARALGRRAQHRVERDGRGAGEGEALFRVGVGVRQRAVEVDAGARQVDAAEQARCQHQFARDQLDAVAVDQRVQIGGAVADHGQRVPRAVGGAAATQDAHAARTGRADDQRLRATRAHVGRDGGAVDHHPVHRADCVGAVVHHQLLDTAAQLQTGESVGHRQAVDDRRDGVLAFAAGDDGVGRGGEPGGADGVITRATVDLQLAGGIAVVQAEHVIAGAQVEVHRFDPAEHHHAGCRRHQVVGLRRARGRAVAQQAVGGRLRLHAAVGLQRTLQRQGVERAICSAVGDGERGAAVEDRDQVGTGPAVDADSMAQALQRDAVVTTAAADVDGHGGVLHQHRVTFTAQGQVQAADVRQQDLAADHGRIGQHALARCRARDGERRLRRHVDVHHRAGVTLHRQLAAQGGQVGAQGHGVATAAGGHGGLAHCGIGALHRQAVCGRAQRQADVFEAVEAQALDRAIGAAHAKAGQASARQRAGAGRQAAAVVHTQGVVAAASADGEQVGDLRQRGAAQVELVSGSATHDAGARTALQAGHQHRVGAVAQLHQQPVVAGAEVAEADACAQAQAGEFTGCQRDAGSDGIAGVVHHHTVCAGAAVHVDTAAQAAGAAAGGAAGAGRGVHRRSGPEQHQIVTPGTVDLDRAASGRAAHGDDVGIAATGHRAVARCADGAGQQHQRAEVVAGVRVRGVVLVQPQRHRGAGLDDAAGLGQQVVTHIQQHLAIASAHHAAGAQAQVLPGRVGIGQPQADAAAGGDELAQVHRHAAGGGEVDAGGGQCRQGDGRACRAAAGDVQRIGRRADAALQRGQADGAGADLGCCVVLAVDDGARRAQVHRAQAAVGAHQFQVADHLADRQTVCAIGRQRLGVGAQTGRRGADMAGVGRQRERRRDDVDAHRRAGVDVATAVADAGGAQRVVDLAVQQDLRRAGVAGVGNGHHRVAGHHA